jgi:hypothetical protein
LISFLLSIAPLVIALSVNWSDYVKTPADGIKLSIGGGMLVVLIFLKAIGRLKMPAKRVLAYMFALAFCYFLQAILNDLVFLLLMATIGEISDLLFVQKTLVKAREQLQMEKQGNVVADKLETIVKKYMEGRE